MAAITMIIPTVSRSAEIESTSFLRSLRADIRSYASSASLSAIGAPQRQQLPALVLICLPHRLHLIIGIRITSFRYPQRCGVYQQNCVALRAVLLLTMGVMKP